jgi:predicted transcriptional regulator
MPTKTNSNMPGRMAVRGLPTDLLDRLAVLAERNERSVEGEARHALKQYVYGTYKEREERSVRTQDANGSAPPTSYEAGLMEAEDAVTRAQAVRDSVERKLNAGSKAVTFDDLAHINKALTAARLRLGEFLPTHPNALRHALM